MKFGWQWKLVLVGAGAWAAFSAEGERKDFTAVQRRWWAIQPVAEQTPPIAHLSRIDAFVHAKLQAKGIAPNAPADKVTLLRRATLDLTGLPPTPEQTQGIGARTQRWRHLNIHLIQAQVSGCNSSIEHGDRGAV